MPYKDKEKAAEHNLRAIKRWRERNPEEHRRRSRESMRKWVAANPEKVKESNRRIREKNKIWWNDFKSTLKCKNCGENHAACLEFHHRVPGEKELKISHYSKSGWFSRQKLLREIEKCDVLCANCHRKEHYPISEGKAQ